MDTMRSVLTQGARDYLDGNIDLDLFIQGIVLAIAESPMNAQKLEDMRWLAAKLTSGS